jgi:hypothetical protein
VASAPRKSQRLSHSPGRLQWTPRTGQILQFKWNQSGKGDHATGKRRTFKPEFKARAVLEELTGVKTAGQICSEHQLSPRVFARCKAEFVKGAHGIVFGRNPDKEVAATSLSRDAFRVML